MIAFYKNYSKTFLEIILSIFSLWLFFEAIHFLYHLDAPLFYGLFIYICIEPFATFLHKKGLPKNIASFISIAGFLLLVFLILFFCGFYLYTQGQHLLQIIPTAFSQLFLKITSNPHLIPYIKTTNLQQYSSFLSSKLSLLVSGILSNVFNFAANISYVFGNLSLGLILSFFLSIDNGFFQNLLKNNSHPTFTKLIVFFKEKVIYFIVKYLKAQLLLMIMTFFIALIGFFLIHQSNQWVLSLVVAVSGTIPFLGVGVAFIPWIFYLLLLGKFMMAIKIASIYLFIGFVRQFTDPKLIGDSLGVPGFVLISFMILFTSLFGLFGLIFSPFLTILVNALYKEGFFKNWIHFPIKRN